MHLGVFNMPQWYKHVPKRPMPVLSLFRATGRLRGNSEPGGRHTAGVTKNWAGGLTLSHVALHDSRRLKPELTSATARRWKGRLECRRWCAEELRTTDKGMKGLVGIPLCLERQLKVG